jgi:type IV secretory pathway VirB6-like protein
MVSFKKIKTRLACFIAIFCIFFQFENAAGASCYPPDHGSYDLTNHGFANIVDGIVGIVSDLLLGRRKGSNFTSVFTGVGNTGNNVDFGDRYWNDGMIYKMFMSVTQNPRFQVIFYLCVIFYVAYLGLSFAIGTAGISTKDIIGRFIKIGIIVFFTTPGGWEAYLELIVKNVTVASRYFNRAIIASMYNVPIENIKNPFQPIDMVFSIVLHKVTWIKVKALIWSGNLLFTILLLMVLLLVTLTCFIVLAKVGILYTTTIVIATVLLCIGPIFFVCLLFEQTKAYFSKWMQNLIGVFMQQYMLFLGFFIFCLIITNLIRGLFYFEICKAPVLSLDLMIKTPKFIRDFVDFIISMINGVLWIFGGKKLSNPLGEYIIKESLVILRDYKPIGSTFALPGDIFTGGALFVVTMIFGKFTNAVMDLGKDISGADISATKIAPKSALESLDKTQQAISDGMSSALLKTATVAPAVIGASHYLNKKRDNWKSEAENQEDKTFTGALKRFKARRLLGATNAVGKVSEGVEFLYQSEETNQRNNLAITNSKMVNQSMKNEIKKLKESGVISDESQLTQEHKDSIKKVAQENLMKNGRTGIIDSVTKREKTFAELSENERKVLMNDAFNRKVSSYGFRSVKNVAGVTPIARHLTSGTSKVSAETDVNNLFNNMTPESRRQKRSEVAKLGEKTFVKAVNSAGNLRSSITDKISDTASKITKKITDKLNNNKDDTKK